MSREMEQLLESDEDLKKIVTGGDVRAGHKIQINFGPGRSVRKEFKALLTMWESGKFFHGGGDGVMYMCLDHRIFEKDNTTPPSALPLLRRMQKDGRTEWGCGSPITAADIRGSVAMCPGCKNMIPIDYLTGQIPFFGSIEELAAMLAILFHRLKDDADLYCKYDRSDIRYETQVKKNGADIAHRLRGLLIYPLYRILQDVGVGSSLESRFLAFIKA